MDKQPQTISFELAKELEKLGIKQDSYFYWSLLPCHVTPVILTYKQYKDSAYEKHECKLYPAYQLYEILDILPHKIRAPDLPNEGYYFTELTVNWLSIL